MSNHSKLYIYIYIYKYELYIYVNMYINMSLNFILPKDIVIIIIDRGVVWIELLNLVQHVSA